MLEQQKRNEWQSRGSKAMCAECGTIYDPKAPWQHPAEECDARQAMLREDSGEETPA